MAHNEMITMRKELKQQRKLFEAHKKCLKNKKIALQDKFMFMIEEMLQIAKETKSINATKSAQKQPRKHPIQTVLDNKKKMLKNNSNGSHSDCIIVATHR